MATATKLPKVPKEQTHFNIKDATVYLQSLGCTLATPYFVRQLIVKGIVPVRKVGKEYIVSRARLDEWLLKEEVTR
jgi:flavin-dependent dehydrogenase